jgi:hypothetical protein
MKRTLTAVVAAACVTLTLSACGSDKGSPSQGTTPGTVISGQQAPGPGGNNDSGNSPGDTAVPATTRSTGATPDTQEKIGDQSPGMGASTP